MKNRIPKIKEIAASETLRIRHKVMWPDKPLDYVKLINDNKGRHFGLFIDNEIIAIISLFINNNEAQFRKFATLNEYQRLGYGTILLNNIIDLIEKEGVKKIWCNARIEKVGFYEKFDFKTTKNSFEKGEIKYVIMEKLL